jgi:tetratricopeptide (TPR) repeat protein
VKTLRRTLLVAALAARSLAPLAAAALLLPACPGKTKPEVAEPEDDKPKEPSADEVLAAARAAAAANDIEGAHAKYQAATKLKNDRAIVEEHVDFLLDHEMPDAAVVAAKAYYESMPSDSKGSLVYGNALIGAGDLATAVDIATEVVDLQAGNPAGYELRGRALMLAGKNNEGLEDLRKAAELAPKDVIYVTSYGAGLERAGRVDEAALQLRAAIELDNNTARALRLLGIVRRAQFEHQEAVSWLFKATKADPTDAETWYNYAIALNELGDNLEAETSAQKATSLAPGKPAYWYVYGEMLRINKKPDEAIEAYRQAMDGKPPHPKAAAKLALVMYDAGKYAEAEVFLTDSIGLDRDNPYLYYNLGWVYSAQKKYRLGVEAFEKYLELAPKEDGDRSRAVNEIKVLKKKFR